MRTTKKAPPVFAPMKKAAAAATVTAGSPPAKDPEWEVRPCGMLVQKRNPDADSAAAAAPPPLPIRVRVKHGAASHEIYLSPQSSFGNAHFLSVPL